MVWLVLVFVVLLLRLVAGSLDVNRNGFAGEVYYVKLKPLPNDQEKVPLPYIRGDPKPALGFEFGALEKVYAFNFTILECVTARIEHLKSDTVCLIGPNTTTPDAQGMLTYQLRKYSVRYPQDKTTPVSSFSNVVLNISLPKLFGETQYRIFAGDNLGELFVIGSKVLTTVGDPDGNTEVFLVKVLHGTSELSITYSKVMSELRFAGKFMVGTHTKLSSGCDKLILLMNWIQTNETLVESVKQPFNSWLVFIMDHASTHVARYSQLGPALLAPTPKYIFDVECQSKSDLLKVKKSTLFAVYWRETPEVQAAFYHSLVVDISSSGLSFAKSSQEEQKLDDMKPEDLYFYNFASMGLKSSTQNVLILMVFKGNYIKFMHVQDTGVVDSGVPPQMRPKNSVMLPMKHGRDAYSFNIRHYIGSQNIAFLDVLLTKQATLTQQGLLQSVVYKRITIANCRDAHSLPSDEEELGYIMSDNSPLYYHGLDHNIIFVGYRQPNNSLSYQAIVTFQTQAAAGGTLPARANVVMNKVEGSWNPSMPLNATFRGILSDSFILTRLPQEYLKIPINVSITSIREILTPFSENSISISMNSLEGPAVSVSLLTEHKEVAYMDLKQHEVDFERSDVKRASDADEVIFFSKFAAFEEHNKKVGILECSEKYDRKKNKLVKSCRERDSIAIERVALVEAVDFSDNCSSILINARIKSTQETVFLAYDIASNKLIEVTKINQFDQYLMACDKDNYYMAAWNTQTDEPVTEALFNRVTGVLDQARVDADSKKVKGFGLRHIKMTNRANQIPSTNMMRVSLTYFYRVSDVIVFDNYVFNSTVRAFQPQSSHYRVIESEDQRDAQVCFFKKNYIVFPKNLSPTSIIYSRDRDNEQLIKFDAQELYNLGGLGFSRVKRVFCHALNIEDTFSVYGEQVVTHPNMTTETHSIIVTFRLKSDPLYRVYNLIRYPTIYDSVKCSDDRRDSIYFDMKENSISKFVRVRLTDRPLLLYFDNVAEPQLDLTLIAKNQYNRVTIPMNVKFTQAQSIKVVPKTEKIKYEQNKVLSVSDLVSSISGNVLKIEPKNLTGVEVVETIVKEGPPSDPVPKNSFIQTFGGENYASVQTSGSFTVIYQKPEHYFLVYHATQFRAACQNPYPRDSTIFKVTRSHPTLNRVYIVYVVDSYLVALYVDLSTSPAKCSLPKELMNGANVVGSHSDYRYLFLYSNQLMEPTSQVYIMAAAIERKEGSLSEEKLEYYTNTDLADPGVVSVAEGVYDTIAGTSPGYLAPATEKIEYCQTIQFSEQSLIVEQITVCTVYAWTNRRLSIKPKKILVINQNPQEKTTFFYMYSVDIPATFFDENRIENLRCSFSQRNLVACLIKDDRDSLYVFKLKRIPYDSQTATNTSKCNSQGQFCFDLEGNLPASKGGTGILLSKDSQFETFNSFQVGNHSVVLAFQKPSSNCSILIYKLNSTEVSISHQYGLLEKTRDVAAGQFNTSRNGFFIYNPTDLTFRVFYIADFSLKFTASSLQNLQGSILFLNSRSETQDSFLDLRNVFKEETGLITNPNTSTSKPLIIVVVAVVVVTGAVAGVTIYYLFKRRRLLKELEQKDSFAINSLDQFYFHER